MVKDLKGVSGASHSPERPLPQIGLPSPSDYVLPKTARVERAPDQHQFHTIVEHARSDSVLKEVSSLHGNGPLGVACALASHKISHAIARHSPELKGAL